MCTGYEVSTASVLQVVMKYYNPGCRPTKKRFLKLLFFSFYEQTGRVPENVRLGRVLRGETGFSFPTVQFYDQCPELLVRDMSRLELEFTDKWLVASMLATMVTGDCSISLVLRQKFHEQFLTRPSAEFIAEVLLFAMKRGSCP